ncbi:unnamed protein product, partial [Closterium sp. NIES-53]
MKVISRRSFDNGRPASAGKGPWDGRSGDGRSGDGRFGSSSAVLHERGSETSRSKGGDAGGLGLAVQRSRTRDSISEYEPVPAGRAEVWQAYESAGTGRAEGGQAYEPAPTGRGRKLLDYGPRPTSSGGGGLQSVGGGVEARLETPQ